MFTSYLKRLFSPKQTLAEELAECCDTIVTMAKRGERINAAGEVDYKFLRILDLANGLRGELLQRHILLTPNDTECVVGFSDTGVTEYRVRTEFTFSNGRESITQACYGVGQNSDGTALSVAQTMALKALLKRMGLIFGEEDDQELSTRDDTNRVSAHDHDRQAKRKNTVSTRQITKLHNAAVLSGKPTAMIALYLQEHFGILQMSDLPKDKFEEALAWATGTEDLTSTLTNSLKVVESRKAPESAA